MNLQKKADSPLQLEAWSAALRFHPDAAYVGYLLSGIQHGFRIGYTYPRETLSGCQNLPSTKEHPQIIAKYFDSEVAKGRILGPFPVGAIPEIQNNPVGILPNKSSPGKWRLTGKSVNDGINSETTTLSCLWIDEVASQIAVYGKNTKLAKVDIEEAYRLVPIHADDKQILGDQWEKTIYVDATLPFGLRSAPIIFTALADGLEWILHQRGIPYIAHYLDNFIKLGAPNSDQCSSKLVNHVRNWAYP